MFVREPKALSVTLVLSPLWTEELAVSDDQWEDSFLHIFQETDWLSDYLNGVHSQNRMCAAQTDP